MAADGIELGLEALSHGVERIHRRHIEKIPILNKVTSGSKSKPRRDSSASDSDRSYSQNGYHQDSRAQDSPRDIRSNYDGSHGYYQNQAYGAQPHRAPSPIMGDSYYPPAGQGDYPRRYNPQDYQPRKEEGYNAYANDSYGREQYAPVSLRLRSYSADTPRLTHYSSNPHTAKDPTVPRRPAKINLKLTPAATQHTTTPPLPTTRLHPRQAHPTTTGTSPATVTATAHETEATNEAATAAVAMKRRAGTRSARIHRAAPEAGANPACAG